MQVADCNFTTEDEIDIPDYKLGPSMPNLPPTITQKHVLLPPQVDTTNQVLLSKSKIAPVSDFSLEGIVQIFCAFFPAENSS